MSPAVSKESVAGPSPHNPPWTKLRTAQREWRRLSIAERLAVIRRARHLVARHAEELAKTIQLPQRRDMAESVAAEVYPLADAMRYLERNAAKWLRPRRESQRDRTVWGRGLQVTTYREPLGVILVIGTWNYPLFLTGVQSLQALVAGNAVIVKPGMHGRPVMQFLLQLLQQAGLPADLMHITGEETEAAKAAIQPGVAKVVFTGSAETGRQVMHQLSRHGIPSVMELSGCDAVFVLPSADLDRVAKCLRFGIQINSGATCIAPRRVFASPSTLARLRDRLLSDLRQAAPVPVYPPAGRFAESLIAPDDQPGMRRWLPEVWPSRTDQDPFPISILKVTDPQHPVLQNDIFAPVISLIPAADPQAALRQDAECPYALGATIFGDPAEAQAFAQHVDAGCVVINDLIAPTADPRVAFGGRGRSGFGTTRGGPGLLEMTQIKTVVMQTSRWLPHLDPPIPELGPMLVDLVRWSHGQDWRTRLRALQGLMTTGRAYWSKSRTKHD